MKVESRIRERKIIDLLLVSIWRGMLFVIKMWLKLLHFSEVLAWILGFRKKLKNKFLTLIFRFSVGGNEWMLCSTAFWRFKFRFSNSMCWLILTTVRKEENVKINSNNNKVKIKSALSLRNVNHQGSNHNKKKENVKTYAHLERCSKKQKTEIEKRK